MEQGQEQYGFVDMGTKVSQYPIDKYRGAKGRRDRISLLSNKPLVTKSHYHDKIGSFYYLREAVEHGLGVNVRYNFVIVIWDTDNKGAITSLDNWQLAVLSTGYEAYQNLCDKFELNGDLTKFQMLVTCLDDTYQKLSFELAGPAPYIENKDLFKEIKSSYKENLGYVPLVIAQKIDVKSFLERAELTEVSTEGFGATQLGQGKQSFDVSNQLDMGGEAGALPENTAQESTEETTVEVVEEVKEEEGKDKKADPKDKKAAAPKDKKKEEKKAEVKEDDMSFDGFDDE